MQQRIYHGSISPELIAQGLMAEFGRDGFRVQRLGDPDHVVVQIARPEWSTSGGHTSITVQLVEAEDGVLVRLGEQAWLGVAASLGVTALSALRNPLSLLGRLDDLAQDIGSLQLSEGIWRTIDLTADALGASLELSENLRRAVCSYCRTANPVGAGSCQACGAPMGLEQPLACSNCGFASPAGTETCPECGTLLLAAAS
ncbi:MAG TPA: zinc ribbon domain-containing protein [Anaerolineales bacterium]|jgi:ribosomal protein L40E